jgi:hypothetical protein
MGSTLQLVDHVLNSGTNQRSMEAMSVQSIKIKTMQRIENEPNNESLNTFLGGKDETKLITSSI